jgi:hypothetical protein
MKLEEKHPHINRPSVAQLTSLLENKAPAISELYLNTHQLVLNTLPDVIYSVDCKDGMLGYGAKQYGYNGWGMAALAAHSKWISLIFMLGADLEDPDKLLEGSGKKIRHVKIHSSEQFERKRGALQVLIEAASKLTHKIK